MYELLYCDDCPGRVGVVCGETMPPAVIESRRLLSGRTRRIISLKDALTKLSTHDANTDDLAAGDNWELGEGLGLLLLATPSRSSQHTRLVFVKDTMRHWLYFVQLCRYLEVFQK